MNRVLLAGCAAIGALCIAPAAQAADVAPAAYDWTGFYLGANAGAAFNNSSVTNNLYLSRTDTAFEGFRNSTDGGQTAFTAGGLLGYNYQIGQMVLGAETDFNYLGFSESNENHFNYLDNPDLPYSTKASFEADWFGTIRARLGFAVDHVMIYGTGGAAYGHVVGTVEDAVEGADRVSFKASADDVNWGWTVGAGVEYGLDRWSLGVEYLYVDLGEADWSRFARGDTIRGEGDYAFGTLRATAKYNFR